MMRSCLHCKGFNLRPRSSYCHPKCQKNHLYQTDADYRARVIAQQLASPQRTTVEGRARRNLLTRRRLEDPAYKLEQRKKRKVWEDLPEVKEHRRVKRIQQRYGLSLLDLEGLKDRQGWRCALCPKPFPVGPTGKAFAVDRCHATGRIRGVLCAGCNTALGKLGDNAEGLQRALDYVKG